MNIIRDKINLRFLFCLWMVGMCAGLTACGQKSMGEKQALAVAQNTDEVRAFYELNKGRSGECVEHNIVRPCDSDWVTCIEDAWVVRFFISEKCIEPFNERLGVTLLIDGKTGRILSKYPEMEYFQNPEFCRDSYDCMKNADGCLNFIYALSRDGKAAQDERCSCRETTCAFVP